MSETSLGRVVSDRAGKIREVSQGIGGLLGGVAGAIAPYAVLTGTLVTQTGGNPIGIAGGIVVGAIGALDVVCSALFMDESPVITPAMLGGFIGGAAGYGAGTVVGEAAGIGAGVSEAAFVRTGTLKDVGLKRKDLMRDLQTIDIQGVKANYRTIFSGEDNELKGFMLSPLNSKNTEKNSLFVDVKNFENNFTITGINDKLSLDKSEAWLNDHGYTDKEYLEIIEEFNSKYGLGGECSALDNSKIYFAVTPENMPYKCYMYLESKDTKKPRLDYPIVVEDKTAVISVINKLKQ